MLKHSIYILSLRRHDKSCLSWLDRPVRGVSFSTARCVSLFTCEGRLTYALVLERFWYRPWCSIAVSQPSITFATRLSAAAASATVVVPHVESCPSDFIFLRNAYFATCWQRAGDWLSFSLCMLHEMPRAARLECVGTARDHVGALLQRALSLARPFSVKYVVRSPLFRV